jgi:hypothetical protein
MDTFFLYLGPCVLIELLESNLAINETETNNKFETPVMKNRNARFLGLQLFSSPFVR